MMPFLRRHAAALLLALTLGAGAFTLLYHSSISVPHFTGIYKEITDDQVYYLARARDVIDGHPLISNPYLAEHKDEPSVQVWLPDYLLAAPLGLLHIPVEIGYLLYNLIFLPLLFLLLYAIVLELTHNKYTAVVTSFFFYYGLFLNEFIRLPSPEFNFVFLLLTILFFIRGLRTGKKADLVIAILSFGSLFYIYPYYWTHWVIVLCIYSVLNFFLFKDKLYKQSLLILGSGIVIGLPYFFSQWQSSHIAVYNETLLRLGLVHTHFPSGIVIVVWGVALLALISFAWWRGMVSLNSATLFLVSALAASLIAVNQHVITGANIIFTVHYYLGSVLLFLLAGAYCVAAWLKTERGARMQWGALIMLSVISLWFAGGATVRFIDRAYAYAPQDVYEQKYAPIFEWLNSNTTKDQVVFADDELSALVPVYTSDNVYSAELNSTIFFMSDNEAQSRYVINHFWDSYTPEYVAAHEASLFGLRYSLAYAHLETENKLRSRLHVQTVPTIRLPDEAVNDVLALAKNIQSQRFETQLKRYKVDYVLWDPAKEPEWRLERYPFLSKQFETNGILVYKVRE